MRRRVVVFACDLCGTTDEFDKVTDAAGWRRDDSTDLCPHCVVMVGPLRCARSDCDHAVVRKPTGRQPLYCSERCRWVVCRRRRVSSRSTP